MAEGQMIRRLANKTNKMNPDMEVKVKIVITARTPPIHYFDAVDDVKNEYLFPYGFTKAGSFNHVGLAVIMDTICETCTRNFADNGEFCVQLVSILERAVSNCDDFHSLVQDEPHVRSTSDVAQRYSGVEPSFCKLQFSRHTYEDMGYELTLTLSDNGVVLTKLRELLMNYKSTYFDQIDNAELTLTLCKDLASENQSEYSYVWPQDFGKDVTVQGRFLAVSRAIVYEIDTGDKGFDDIFAIEQWEADSRTNVVPKDHQFPLTTNFRTYEHTSIDEDDDEGEDTDEKTKCVVLTFPPCTEDGRLRDFKRDLYRRAAEYREVLKRNNESDTVTSEKDKFPLPSHIEQANRHTVPVEPEAPYYEPQIHGGRILAARVKYNLKARGVDFKKFTALDFMTYTENANILEDQTIARLGEPLAEVFAESFYQVEQKALRTKLNRYVHKYVSSAVTEERHRELRRDVENKPNTLFIIIADEAHRGFGTVDSKSTTKNARVPDGSKEEEKGSGDAVEEYGAQKTETITASGVDDSAAARHKFINTWPAKKYPNVVIILVTATPYNLIGENKPTAAREYCARRKCESDSDLEFIHVTCTEDGTFVDECGEVRNKAKLLDPHHMHYSECNAIKYKSGSLVTLATAITTNLQQLGVQLRDTSTSTSPEYTWSFGTAKTRCIDFVLEGTPNAMTVACTIHDTTFRLKYFPETYALKLKRSRRDKTIYHDLRFVPTSGLPSREEQFRMIEDFGADLFALETSDGHDVIFGDHFVTVMTEKDYTKGKKEKKPKKKRNGGNPISTFVIKSQRLPSAVSGAMEYLSPNDYFNSLRDEDPEKQYLRADVRLQEIVSDACRQTHSELREKRTSLSVEVALICEYLFSLLLVDILRAQTLSTNDDIFNNDINIAFHDMLERFRAKLPTGSAPWHDGNTTNCLPSTAVPLQTFNEYCYRRQEWHVKKITVFVRQLNLRHTGERETSSEDVAGYMLCCALFVTTEEFQADVKGAIEELKTFPEKWLSICRAYYKCVKRYNEDQLCKDFKKKTLYACETLRIVDDLVLPKYDPHISPDTPMEGRMKLVRMIVSSSGNMMYESIVLARELTRDAKEDYQFEVLRVFDKFRIKALEENKDEALFRIHQILQTKKCETCQCKDYRPHGDKTSAHQCKQCGNVYKTPARQCKKCGYLDKTPAHQCTGCEHVHKRVETYRDLDRLPVLIILVEKGRLGDTFPHSMNVMDLRARGNVRNIATFVQEIGRMCRYSDKNGSIHPYALLGKGIYNKLKKALNTCTSMRGLNLGAKHPKQQILDNMILLEAEPQCGKTGTYMYVLKSLRQEIEEAETEDDFIDEESDYDDDDNDHITGQDHEEDTLEIISKSDDWRRWKMPYWMDMLRSGKFDKVSMCRHTRMYGEYRPGVPPQKRDYEPPVRRTPRGRCPVPKNTNSRNLKYDECKSSCCIRFFNSKVQTVSLDNRAIEVDISVPLRKRYQAVHQKLRMSEEAVEQSQEHSLQRSDEELTSWIFTPSYGRAKRAYVNYYHNMVDGNGKPVNYVHFLVVRSSEFREYRTLWGKSHVILGLPDRVPGWDYDAVSGGVGYARLIIQKFAEHWQLGTIFMLDDTIVCVKEIKHDAKSVHRQDGEVSYETATMYDMLSHMENNALRDQQLPMPRGEFDPFVGTPGADDTTGSESPGSGAESPGSGAESSGSESLGIESQGSELYTGPRDRYAVLGVQKWRRTINKVRHSFRRCPVYSCVLLNIDALSEACITYKPWPVFEDCNLNSDVNAKGLYVCKSQRYVVQKASGSCREVHRLLDEDKFEVREDLKPVDEVDILHRFINNNYRPGRIDVTGSNLSSHLNELRNKISQIKEHSVMMIGGPKAPLKMSATLEKWSALNRHNFIKFACVLPMAVCQEEFGDVRTLRNECQKYLPEFRCWCYVSKKPGTANCTLVVVTFNRIVTDATDDGRKRKEVDSEAGPSEAAPKKVKLEEPANSALVSVPGEFLDPSMEWSDIDEQEMVRVLAPYEYLHEPQHVPRDVTGPRPPSDVIAPRPLYDVTVPRPPSDVTVPRSSSDVTADRRNSEPVTTEDSALENNNVTTKVRPVHDVTAPMEVDDDPDGDNVIAPDTPPSDTHSSSSTVDNTPHGRDILPNVPIYDVSDDDASMLMVTSHASRDVISFSSAFDQSPSTGSAETKYDVIDIDSEDDDVIIIDPSVAYTRDPGAGGDTPRVFEAPSVVTTSPSHAGDGVTSHSIDDMRLAHDLGLRHETHEVRAEEEARGTRKQSSMADGTQEALSLDNVVIRKLGRSKVKPRSLKKNISLKRNEQLQYTGTGPQPHQETWEEFYNTYNIRPYKSGN